MLKTAADYQMPFGDFKDRVWILALLLCRLTFAADLESRKTRLPKPPFVVNCSPVEDEREATEEDEERRRQWRGERPLVLRDRAYSLSAGYGYESGRGLRPWFAAVPLTLGEGWDVDLFATGRIGPKSYRFDLPPGEYIVVIGVCETLVHTAGRRVFDIVIQGREAIEALDPVGTAGFSRPFCVVQEAAVGDQGLTVIFRPRRGSPPCVSAIWVYPYRQRHERPSAPRHLRAIGSYGINRLSWRRPNDETLSGYLVERQAPGEEHYTAITGVPLLVTHFEDENVRPGLTYSYRVRSVDVNDRQSEPTSPVTVACRALEESTLPVYSIELPPEGVSYMLSRIEENRSVRGDFLWNQQRYPVEVRLHGASTRYSAKRSYRIRFLEASPLSRKVTFLKAQQMDHTLQQEKLSCDLFQAAGLPVSQASYVNLFVNGRYEGVYVDVEPIRSPFKKRVGLDPQGTLIRAHTFQYDENRWAYGELRGTSGRLEELAEFIRKLNHVDRGDFEEFMRTDTDWPKVLDYLVLGLLCHRSEIEANDYFFYRDPESGKWSFIPWDHNNGNFGVVPYQNSVGEPFISLFHQCIQQVGWRPSYSYVLPSRVFNNQNLRREYLRRVDDLTRTLLLSGRVDSLIETNFKALKEEFVVDPFRWPFDEEDPFLRSARDLKRFVRDHAHRILRLTEAERAKEPPPLLINEFAFGPKEGWVELYNPTERPVSLAGYSLVGGYSQGGKAQKELGDTVVDAHSFRVLTFPYHKTEWIEPEDAEERELLELRGRSWPVFPGFDPAGGFVMLTVDSEHRQREANEDEEREKVVDFYFYGPQGDRSYGRHAEGFSFMTPTPGRANQAPGQ